MFQISYLGSYRGPPNIDVAAPQAAMESGFGNTVLQSIISLFHPWGTVSPLKRHSYPSTADCSTTITREALPSKLQRKVSAIACRQLQKPLKPLTTARRHTAGLWTTNSRPTCIAGLSPPGLLHPLVHQKLHKQLLCHGHHSASPNTGSGLRPKSRLKQNSGGSSQSFPVTTLSKAPFDITKHQLQG